MLADVTSSESLPDDTASVVYVGHSVKGVIAYTRSRKVLSITGEPTYVRDGVTLGVAIENTKPKILLNLSSTKAENIYWNPQILKVVLTIE